MSRRNRVDPLGDLHAVGARGLFTGNRGCLVDDNRCVVRHHTGSLWITCVTKYRDWEHALDAPRTWTPVFFLDDAVALAAGHRPCGLCRRDAYRAYRHAVTVATGARSPVLAPELNRRLATERHHRGRGLDRAADRILSRRFLRELPAGAVVVDPSTGDPLLVTGGPPQPFTFDGWLPPIELSPGALVDVITPPTSLAALANGFLPALHPTAIAQTQPRPSATAAVSS